MPIISTLMPIISTLMPIIVADRPPRRPPLITRARARTERARLPCGDLLRHARVSRAEREPMSAAACARVHVPCGAEKPWSIIISPLQRLSVPLRRSVPLCRLSVSLCRLSVPLQRSSARLRRFSARLQRPPWHVGERHARSAPPHGRRASPRHAHAARRSHVGRVARAAPGRAKPGRPRSQSGLGYARPGPFQARLWNATLLVIGARRAGAQQRPAAPGGVIDRCLQNVRAVPRTVVSRDVVSHGSIGRCLPNATAP
jgi:hypothetical protein